ncbi:MAG TPA: hypothetical protein VGB58_00920, partial [Blastococcus sp.]
RHRHDPPGRGRDADELTQRARITAARPRPGRRGEFPMRPMTLIGVAALAEPDLMVEVVAVAVLA